MMPGEQYEKIKKLFEENSLVFGCRHKHYIKEKFEKGHSDFLSFVEKGRNWGEEYALRDIECDECGERIHYYLDGETLVPSNLTCFNESEIIVEIDIPSGFLLFADMIKYERKVTEHLIDRKVSLNSTKGVVKRTLDMAKGNIAQVCVGNTSPNVYQLGDAFFIGKGQYDEEEDEYLPIVENAKEIGYVSTDVWWVTCVDYVVYEKMAIDKFGEEMGKKMAMEAKDEADIVIQVPPGRYKLTYYTQVDEDSELYAKLEKNA